MNRKLTIVFACSAIFFAYCKKGTTIPQAEVQAVWSSSAQYASWANGGYTLYNNIWGSGAGSQSIWANSFSQWGVWANHPNTGGVKSYPNCTKNVNRTISSLGSLTSAIGITTPSGGAWNAAYDVWDNNHQHEIMLWMNYTSNSNGSGNIKPISYNWTSAGNPIPVFTNISIGGTTWNVFRGSNGSNNVYSFLRTTKTNNATVNIKAIAAWIQSQGWFGNITIGDVQFGYEITSSYGTNGAGLNWTTNSFSVSFN